MDLAFVHATGSGQNAKELDLIQKQLSCLQKFLTSSRTLFKPSSGTCRLQQ